MKRERNPAGLKSHLLLAGALIAAAFPAPLLAQIAPAMRGAAPADTARGRDLTAALARLARNPRDVDALIAAGTAALAAGDADASLGFFTRADELSKDNPRVKAGLAGAMVRSENPYDAIPLFEAAERAGAIDSAFVGERGLAYDLVGDNPSAQRYYLDALRRGANDEITRRLAISYAIVGRRAQAEAALLPQLQRQDPAAWRARAFAMAILGAEDEAISIAYATMPKELAAGISPYLRYMPRLTPAQQAAAANFGHFPRAADIGRDDPRTLRFAVAVPRTNGGRRADASLIPAGQPLGGGSQVAVSDPPPSRDRRRRPGSEQTVATPPPEIAPAQTAVRETAIPPQNTPIAPSALSAHVGPARAAAPIIAPIVPKAAVATAPGSPIASALPASPKPAPVTILPPATRLAAVTAATAPARAVVPVSAPSSAASGVPVPARAAPGPGFDLAALAGPTRPAVTNTPSAAPAAVPARTAARSLAEAFGDLVATTGPVTPAAGAVDIRTIKPARAASAASAVAVPAVATPRGGKPVKAVNAPPPPPAHPSRIWVQLATERDKSALAFDWRRMTRTSAELLRSRKAYVAAWGQTNRLLTGPFETEAAATAFLTQARRAGGDGFLWTSPAGQVVDALAVGK